MLHNTLSREELIKRLENETFTRRTVSFYRYVYMEDPHSFRDQLYLTLDQWGCLGRIYVAKEGINAQMSIPEPHIDQVLNELEQVPELKDMPVKWALEDNGRSFLKLIVKVRKKIVADGLSDHQYDVTNVGKHLSAMEFHQELDNKDTVVIDMRNHYESEVGHFKNAYCPDADTFRDAIKIVVDKFRDQKDKKYLLYCTGGIRCEKASAYLKHYGFENVNQLHGGIIEYAQQIKAKGIKPKFKGKNFVFDNRLGESVNGEVIARCHQCGTPCDDHTNCANDDCHLLFIQCDACKAHYNGCCSEDCQHILSLPPEQQKQYRVLRHQKYAESKIFKSRLRPNLMKMSNSAHYNTNDTCMVSGEN